MKNKKRSGGLFGLLARSLLLFTLTLLAIVWGIFCLWNVWLNRLYEPADYQGLLTDPALRTGEYDSLQHYLGSGENAFAVYDDAGVLRYASAAGFDAECSVEELRSVASLEDNVETDAYEIAGETDDKTRYLLVRRIYRSDGTVERVVPMALDADYQVLLGGFEDGKQGYTEREYQYLTGTRFPDSRMFRQEVSDADGRTMTVLFREAYLNAESYYRIYVHSWRIWLLSLPLYLAAAGGFIWWMRRKIGRPLQRLNDAVEAQSAGRLVRVGDCGGTREIRQIGESFDRFSDRLAESEAERRRLDQGRQKLIADISHDLKTPITVIAGYIDAICDGKVPPEETERYLRAIAAKAETLTELVDAFHEYSKVEHPEYVLNPERTDLCEFLREYLARKYDEIDLAGFSLEIAIPEKPIFCQLDPLQFRRVLDNLLANALRHNRLGTMLYFDVEAAPGRAIIRVADNGTGIPPERVRDIFEPFVVGSDARSGKGSGLGLAITRRIVEKHGGTIRLSERPRAGRSTEFVVELPTEE